jgi:hypothetical protein
VCILIGAGLAAGFLLALVLANLVRSQLFGLNPRDPLTFVGSAIVLAVAAGLAGLIPALRASSLAATTALRHDEPVRDGAVLWSNNVASVDAVPSGSGRSDGQVIVFVQRWLTKVDQQMVQTIQRDRFWCRDFHTDWLSVFGIVNDEQAIGGRHSLRTLLPCLMRQVEIRGERLAFSVRDLE